MKYSFLCVALMVTILVAYSPFVSSCYAKEKKTSDKKQDQLLTRIDFGNSYITGQTLKSGAVYLLQRKKSDVKSMLKYREDYRREILEAHDIKELKEKK